MKPEIVVQDNTNGHVGVAHGGYSTLLRTELATRCKKNQRYSLRAFARSLEVDFSLLSKIISGKRCAGKKLIEKTGKSLGLSVDTIRDLIEKEADLRAVHQGKHQVPDDDYQTLSLDSFKVISEWYHYAILEVMELDNFVNDPKWVARVLGISVPQVKSAFERLMRVGILEKSENGAWIDRSHGYSTTTAHSFSTAAFRSFQRQILSKALRALEEIPIEERDQTSITFSGDSSLIPEAKARIKKFRRNLARLFNMSKKRDHVYHLGVSLYPITRDTGVRK